MKKYILPNFDAEKLNQRISKAHRIKYKKICINQSGLKEGMAHIRERHINDIVCIYCSENKKIASVKMYCDMLSLPEASFQIYHDNLKDIGDRVRKITDGMMRGRIERVRNLIYDPNEIRHLEGTVRKDDVDDIRSKLLEARSSINDNEINKINKSLLFLLDRTVSGPSKILLVEGEDKHLYFSQFKYKNRRLTIIVGCDNGAVITAYIKKPPKISKRSMTHYIQIYPK